MAITTETLSIAYFSGNPIWVSCTSDQLGVVDNLRIKCLVVINNIPGVYRSVAVYETVNAASAFVFNIGPLIDGMMRDWFDVADFTVVSKINPIAPIRAEIFLTEVYEGTTGDSATEFTYIVHGGLRLEELDTINDWWTTFEIYAAGDRTKIPFLTNKPNRCIWRPGQPEFLYYYNYLGSTSLVLNIEYFDVNDGSIDFDEFTLAAVGNNKMVQFNIGKVMQDRYDSSPTDAYYKISINDGSDIVSEVRTYGIDKEYYPNQKYLLFENKKGGFDTVALIGDELKGGSVEGAYIGKEYLRAQHVVDAVRTVIKRQVQRSVKKNSGWLTKLERHWLMELLESKQVYEVTGYIAGGYEDAVLLPVVIESKDLPSIGSAEFLNGTLIEWSYGN